MKKLLSALRFRSFAERVALLSGALAMLVGLAHLAAFLVTEGAVWSGPIGYRKPAMFGFSVGMTLLSLGWLARYFPSRPRWQAFLFGVMSGTLLLEIAIIGLQRMRGVPSHFNMATAFDGALWTMMGLAINLFAVLAVALAVQAFGRLEAAPPMRLAIRFAAGLLVISQLSGHVIVFHGANIVLPDGEFVAANIPRAATFGDAGNLKLPHAIALHGLQVLPLLGLLLGRLNWDLRAGRRWVALSGVGFLGLVVTTQFQAFTGRAVFDMAPTVAGAFLLSLLLWTFPWVRVGGAYLGEASRCRTPLASSAVKF